MHIALRSWRSVISAAAVGIVVTGCSVMQIDVDVYKGPLANHKDVHTEQVAVMAVGAEPLVQRLLVNLNKQCNEEAEKAKSYEASKVGESNPNSGSAGYGGQEGPICFQTKVVQGILDLFKDREDISPEEALLVLTDKVVSAAKRAQRAGVTLDAKKLANSKQELLFEQLGELLKSEEKSDSEEKLRQSLALSYRNFLKLGGKKFRPWGPIFYVLRDSKNHVADPQTLLGPIVEMSSLPDKAKPLRRSSNLAYEILQEETFLEAQADFLFAEADDADLKKTAFVQEISSVARSYTDAREAVSEMLVTTLRGLTLADKVTFKSPESKQRLIVDVAEFVAGTLMQLEHLQVALLYARSMKSSNQLREMLEAKLPTGTPLLDATWGQIQTALTTLIIEQPVATSHMLLALNGQYPQSNFLLEEPYPNKFEKHKQPERRRYGLAAGPQDKEFLSIVEDGAKSIAKDAKSSLDPLQDGRFRRGIFTLINDYLYTLEDNTLGPCGVGPLCENELTKLETQRQLLLMALVHFAEKVLFVVNNEILFDDAKTANEDYVLVLQTVGNSILVHVDAIFQEADHVRRLEQGTDREIAAISQVFGGGATLAFTQLTQSLRDRIKTKEAELTKLTETLKKAEAEQTKAKAAVAAAEAAERGAPAPTGSSPTATTAMTRLQAAWQSLGQDPKVLDSSAGAAEAKDEAVKAEIDALVADESLEPAQIYDKITEVLTDQWTGELAASPPLTPRASRLKQAIAQFNDSDFKGKFSNAAATTAEQRKKIEDTIKAVFFDEKLKFLNANKVYFTALDAHNRAKEASATAKKAEKTAQDTRDATEKAKTKAQTELASLKKAQPFIAKAQGKVIAQAEKSPERPLSRAVYLELIKHLRAEVQAGNVEQAVLDVAETLPIPLVTPSGYSVDAKNAKDVLDGLIASLRQLYTRTQLENNTDENNKAIARAAAALAEAYRQRADMVYIRPAMAYLRTSFTATTLQDNRLAWRNMLAHHGYRSTVPIIPGLIARNDAKVAEEIDKQFWHSVNRVRVAGAGDTNYVIAKDDLGNWYVKSYSTDVKDIIKSAKNLALFAAGPSLGVPIPLDVETDPKKTVNQDGTTPAAGLAGEDSDVEDKKPEPAKSVFVKQFEKFRDKFRAESKRDIGAAQEAAKSFKDRIKKDWKDRGLDDETIGKLETILDPGDQDPINTKLLKLGEVEAKDAPRKLAQGLRAVRDYHLRVTQAIKNKQGLDGPQKELAIGSITDIVLRSELKQLIDRARQNMDRFAVELEIIGETGTDLDISEISD